jgi:hypothetical protein
MATILEFRSESERGPARVARRRRRTAEIVIFPGVRYERYVSDAGDRHGAPKVERDLLKLVE